MIIIIKVFEKDQSFSCNTLKFKYDLCRWRFYLVCSWQLVPQFRYLISIFCNFTLYITLLEIVKDYYISIIDTFTFIFTFNWTNSQVCNVGINRRRLASKLGVKCRPFTILTSAAKIYPSSGREIVTNYQPFSWLECFRLCFTSMYFTVFGELKTFKPFPLTSINLVWECKYIS